MSQTPRSDQPLESVTQEHDARQTRAIKWYRTKLTPDQVKTFHRRSDLLGWMQTLGFLFTLVGTGALAFYSYGHWPIIITVLLTFLHGTVHSFQINAVHELGHGTVFKTRKLNAFFCRVFSFLGWINFHKFEASHAEHHRYTLHPPDDLEVVLPIRVVVKDFFRQGFFHYQAFWFVMKSTVQQARGKFVSEWENHLFPASDPDARKPPIRWARFLLAGHGTILVVSLLAGWVMLPVLVSLGVFYGGWLLFLCNKTQHIGLQDDVEDFRLCCRTFTVNPVVQFLYWHMNYHTEHHMYAAVPCYRLGSLHRAIRHDLPPTPRGIAATWREIAQIQKHQEADPGYQHRPILPGPLARVSGSPAQLVSVDVGG